MYIKTKLKKVGSERIYPNVEILGDPVFFYDHKKKQPMLRVWMIQCSSIMTKRNNEKTLYFLRRVAIDKDRPDINSKTNKEVGYAETENAVDGGRKWLVS